MAFSLPPFTTSTQLSLLSLQSRTTKTKALKYKIPQFKNNMQQQKQAGTTSNKENKTGKMRGIKLMEFPHLLSSHRQLMVDLISAVDRRLAADHINASSLTVPSDVEYYESSIGSSQGALSINRGRDSSPIDFILSSWLHLKLTGGAMNITNLQGYMKPTTLIPHFQFELVQVNPAYFIFFLDLTPRKDLVLSPGYLKTFYEDTNLESHRKQLETLVPEAKPYFSSSLYFRNVVSPTGILVGINCEDGGSERVEGTIRECISPIAGDVLEIWIDCCLGEMNNSVGVGEDEIEELKRRDVMIKSKAVDMDLSSSMPLQFGQDVASRVLGVIRNAYGIS